MGRVATQVASWQRQHGRRGAASSFTAAPAGSGAAPFGPTVEIYYGEAWHDISPYVFYESRISISRGRPDESTAANPATCDLVLNNRLGYFSPRNPTSPLYGLIGRNTPLRVSKVVNGTRFYRFTGEVVAWPTTWDLTGNDIRTPIEVAGIKRRLGQGDKPVNSAMFREHTKPSRVGIVGYWPCEDATNAGQIASGLPQNSAMTVSGTPTYAAYSDWKASDALLNLNGASLSGTVAGYTGSSLVAVDANLLFNAAPSANGRIFSMATTGSACRWEVSINTGGAIQMKGYDSSGATLADSGLVASNTLTDGLVLARMQMTQNGTGIDWFFETFPLSNSFTADQSLAGSAFVSGTLASNTVGQAKSLTVAPDRTLTDVVCGHIGIGADLNSFAHTVGALTAWNGENPANRYIRLCGEQGLSFEEADRPFYSNPVTMGWQGLQTLGDLFQQVVDTDLGPDYEPRDQVGLTYRRRTSLYNQTARLTLDYAAHELSIPFSPTDDDQKTVNDVTVTRDGGSFARAVLEEGALSSLDPPDGVGTYDVANTYSLGSDTQTLDQAGWRLHLGTVDEPRYPAVDVQLSHPSFSGSYALTSAALALEIGDRLDIMNPPTPSPPDAVSLLVQSYTETFDQFLHEMTFVCTPYSPWNVAFADDTVYGQVDTDGSSLNQDYTDPTATSLLVDVTSGALWTTSAGDMPFDISVGGEVMTVTGISGSSTPQTFTVTRAVNGVAKAQTAGTDVRLAHPMIIGL